MRADLVVLEEGPELLQTVQRSAVVIFQRLCLEVLEHILAEFLLQTVAVEPKQALQPIPAGQERFC